MTGWRLLIRIVATISLVLLIWGSYWLVGGLWREFRHPVYHSNAPFFRAAFFALSAIDATFIVAMLLAVIRLLRLDKSAVTLYTWLTVIWVVCFMVIGMLWTLRYPYGVSIAAASGIGSVGAGPFLLYPVPFAYPVVSVLFLNLARYRLKNAQSL
jgi:hypothetical protein